MEERDFFKEKRIKILSVFAGIFAFYFEPFLRRGFIWLSGFFLDFIGETKVGGHVGLVLKEILSLGSPYLCIYFPATIALIVIVKDGIQKFDWISAPFFVGILFKAILYSSLCLKYKSGEVWKMVELGIPQYLFSFFNFCFFCIGIWSLFVLIKEIVESDAKVKIF